MSDDGDGAVCIWEAYRRLLGYIRKCGMLIIVHHDEAAGCILCCLGQVHEGQHAVRVS